jgi:3-phenylpropionate/cinnamic acid dioxygenase small subunit
VSAGDDRLRVLAAKDEILDVVNELFLATDRKDWDAVRACFMPSVAFDMTSLAGGVPATLSPAQIAEAWETGLRPIDVVHHQTGNHRVRLDGDDRAEAFCYGTATHFRRRPDGRNVRTFVGSYDFELVRRADGWRISHFRFTLKYLDGNLELERD